MYDHAFIMKNYSYFEGEVTHMTTTNTTQVLDEYPPTRAGRAPPLPDHTGPIPGYIWSSVALYCFRKGWAAQYEVRNLKALSAAPYVLFPTHYIGDEGYFSDTETSTFAPRTNKSRIDNNSGAPASKEEL